MSEMRGIWQKAKGQLDSKFGKGFSDKCKTKTGDKLDSLDKLLDQLTSEQKFLSKAVAELEATIAAIDQSKRGFHSGMSDFVDYVKSAKGLDPKLQKEAVSFLIAQEGGLLKTWKSEYWAVLGNMKKAVDLANSLHDKGKKVL